MIQRQDVAPPPPAEIDTEKPSAARMYDWYLGGTNNWAMDREYAKRALTVFPPGMALARQNRMFMNRVVRTALANGIRQFIDLGSGVPTVGNVHEVVRNHLPAGQRASVVYVDYEPVAAVHATVLLERDGSTDWAGIVQADLRDTDQVLNHRVTRRLINFRQRVCLLMIAVLHFVGDQDQPAEIVRRYQQRLSSGSWLAISHITDEGLNDEQATGVRRFVGAYRHTTNPLWLRDSSQIRSWFGDWRLLEPGLVHLPDWRPERAGAADPVARPFGWAGVAEKE